MQGGRRSLPPGGPREKWGPVHRPWVLKRSWSRQVLWNNHRCALAGGTVGAPRQGGAAALPHPPAESSGSPGKRRAHPAGSAAGPAARPRLGQGPRSWECVFVCVSGGRRRGSSGSASAQCFVVGWQQACQPARGVRAPSPLPASHGRQVSRSRDAGVKLLAPGRLVIGGLLPSAALPGLQLACLATLMR